MQSSRDIILQVRDLDAAVAFYEAALDRPPFERTPTLAGFETGTFRLFLEPGALPGPVFEFLAPDPDAAKARLLAAGCVIVDEDPSVPRCYMRDPFGLTFNVGRTR